MRNSFRHEFSTDTVKRCDIGREIFHIDKSRISFRCLINGLTGRPSNLRSHSPAPRTEECRWMPRVRVKTSTMKHCDRIFHSTKCWLRSTSLSRCVEFKIYFDFTTRRRYFALREKRNWSRGPARMRKKMWINENESEMLWRYDDE